MEETLGRLDFCDDLNPEFDSFMRFVDNVLFFRDSSDIRKFRLWCGIVEDFSRIHGWIGAAIRRNVVELELSVSDYAGDEDNPRVFELPESVFTCKSLMVLKLYSNLIINTPASGCVSSLKSLHVRVDHPFDTSLEKLLSCCPLLEYLCITGVAHDMQRDDPISNFTVSAPELKTLQIRWSSRDFYLNICNFYINAPKLQDFYLWQMPSTDCFVENAKSLVKVTLSLHDCDHSSDADHRFSIRGTALLAGISCVKCLCLSSHLLKGCILPVFDKLSRLKLILRHCYYWELLKELLKRSPNLDHLVFELNDGYKCAGEFSDHQWSPPVSVPTCLLIQIKTISIKGFEGKLDEMEAAKYLLSYGKVLKKMIIYYNEKLCTKEELHKEFSMFHLGSKTCQLEFFSDIKRVGGDLGLF